MTIDDAVQYRSNVKWRRLISVTLLDKTVLELYWTVLNDYGIIYMTALPLRTLVKSTFVAGTCYRSSVNACTGTGSFR